MHPLALCLEECGYEAVGPNRLATKKPRRLTRRGTSLVHRRPLSPHLSAKAAILPGVRGDLAYRRFRRFTVAGRRRYCTELRSSPGAARLQRFEYIRGVPRLQWKQRTKSDHGRLLKGQMPLLNSEFRGLVASPSIRCEMVRARFDTQ